jgi:hypothetical protein
VGDSLFRGLQEPTACHRHALEAAVLMLASDKSRGSCLEMICADFFAVSLETGNQNALLSALTRLVLRLPLTRREQLFERVFRKSLYGIRSKWARLTLSAEAYHQRDG